MISRSIGGMRYFVTAVYFLALLVFVPYALARGPMLKPGSTTQYLNSDAKFIIYYGDAYYTNTQQGGQALPASQWILNVELLTALSAFDVVVLQPNTTHCTPEVVNYLKNHGVGYVLGYISIGEDAFNPTVESLFTADGSGPYRLDTASNNLVPTNGGIANFYMDVDSQTVTYNADGSIKSITPTAHKVPDGLPDLNPYFFGYMINPTGDWQWVINTMRIGTADVPERQHTAGLMQLAYTRNLQDLRNRSGNFQFDGFFLDTIDTAGPYDAYGWYPWVVEEMQSTVKFISDTYPNHIVFANRGSFYYTAGLKSIVTGVYPIDYSIRPYVNAVLFESLMYDSGPYPAEGAPEGTYGESEYYVTNRYVVTPKLLAEANRPDGFTVFSLEYISGRNSYVPDIVSRVLNQDIRTLGLVTYLADGRSLDAVGTALSSLLPDSGHDTSAPTWETTGNTVDNLVTPSSMYRKGIQRIKQVGANSSNTKGDVIVSWDAVMDQSYPVTYSIQYTNAKGVTTLLFYVPFETGDGWKTNPASKCANQYRINGLPNGLYTFKVIPRDRLGHPNQEDPGYVFNVGPMAIVVDAQLADWKGTTPYVADKQDVNLTGDHMDWLGVWVAYDSANTFFRLKNLMPVSFTWGLQMFVDSDNNPATGYRGTNNEFGIGADYLIQGVTNVGILIYPFNGATQTSWSWDASQADYPEYSWQNGELELRIPDWQFMRKPGGGYDASRLANTIRFFLDGDNTAFGYPNVHDFVPDDANTGGSIEYIHKFN